jgi:uncharacterized protein
MKHFLLFYELESDYLDRRGEFRGVHLGMAWKASEAGELVMAGALVNPTDQAILLFKGESSEAAERFAKTDPYVLNGLVKRWHVREWTTVAGEVASNPVKPTVS